MPLLKNTNQPFFADPNSPATLNCNGTYCYPVNQGDSIYQQWYQTPCGQNEIVDPTFSNATYGANLITNGTFAGSLASWTTTGWVYDTGYAKAPIATSPNDLTQTIVITAATYYRITFDLAGLSAGDELRVYLGSPSSWYSFTENGSYSEIIRSGSGNLDIVFKAGTTNLANALIDNVVLQQVTWGDWDTNGNWALNITDGIACASGAGTGILEEAVTDYIVVGDYYQMTVTVTGVTAGSLTCYVGNVTDVDATSITSNGVYTLYFLPTVTGVVSFHPSTDFVGCVSEPDLRVLRNDYLFEVIDADGNRYDISDYIEYYHDKVTLADPVFDLLELTYDCYTIEVTDRCLVEGINLVTDGTFDDGYTSWTRNNGGGQYNINAGVMEFVFEPLEGSTLITNGDFSGGAASWTLGAGWSISGGGALHTPGSTAVLSQTVSTSPVAVPPSTLIHWIQFTISGRTAGSVTFTLSDKTTTATFSTNEVITFPLAPTIAGSVTFSINPTSNFDGTIDDIGIWESHNPWSDYVILRNVANTDFVAGNYSIEYDQVTNDDPGRMGVAIGLIGMTQALVYDTTVATHTYSVPSYTPGAQAIYFVARFSQGNNYFPGRIGIDNVTAVRVEPFEATYTSECMNYQFEHLNTQLLTGSCDQESFGFDFANTDFILQMRAEVRGLNPIYNKQKNIAQFGTGDARVTYADETKSWTFVTGFMSESAHDCLSTIIDCDHFTIGVIGGNGIEYIAQAEDYTPQWTQDGSYSLAPVTLNLRLKTGGQKFNRHT